MAISDFYNSIVNVVTLTVAADAVGGFGETDSIDIVALPCRIRQLKGDEEWLQGKETVRVTHRMYCASDTAITEKQIVTQVKTSGTVRYKVRRVDNKHQINHHLAVDLEELIS